MAYNASSTLFLSSFPSLSKSICFKPDKSALLLTFLHKFSRLDRGLWLTTLNWLFSSDFVLSSSESGYATYLLLCFFCTWPPWSIIFVFSLAFWVLARLLALVVGAMGLPGLVLTIFFALVTGYALAFLFFRSTRVGSSLASSPSAPRYTLRNRSFRKGLKTWRKV